MSRTTTPVAPGHSLTAQTMGATFVSPVVDASQADGIAWEAVYTGTPTGTFTIESSNQYDAVNNPSATFVAIPAASIVGTLPVPAGAGSQFIVTTPGPSEHGGAGKFQRLRYARTGGTGSLDLWVCGVGRT
jgi:hypothetical protein